MFSTKIKRSPTDAKQTTLKPKFFTDVFVPDEKYGFLPRKRPLSALPEHSDLHVQLNKIAQNLPLLLKTKKLKEEINNLNKKYHATILQLNTIQEKYTAILILTMISQAYIWETPQEPKNIIPSVIGNNLELLCQSLQRFPILTYSDYVLQNWQLKDPQAGFSLENIEPIFTFTETVDEAWFIKIHIAIEAACAPALRSAYDASLLNFQMKKNASLRNEINETRLIHSLKKISDSLRQATIILLRMKEGCDPDYFSHTYRAFLTGWDEKLGIKFEGNKEIHQYKGPSGAQSSILPSLDGVLGIKHKIDGMYQHLLMFKQYMPHKHAFFINLLNLRSIQLSMHSSEQVVKALDNAVESVKQFRYMHRFAMVRRYIERPAEKKGIRSEDLEGTGKTPIGEDDYLIRRHQSTVVTHVRTKALSSKL